jgi:hypothetical protein
MSENKASDTRFLHITSEEFWAKGGGRGKLRNWPKDFPMRPGHTGEFPARLWTLFGAPDEIGFEGFTYDLKDSVTGIVFHAYCGASGPAFGGASVENDEFASVVDALENLINQTPLTDCEVEFDTDFGKYRAGARNGAAFEEEVRN